MVLKQWMLSKSNDKHILVLKQFKVGHLQSKIGLSLDFAEIHIF